MMKNMTALEIKSLIDKYYSELRKLQFQLERTEETIKDLQEELKNTSVQFEVSTVAPTIKRSKKRGPGRPRKNKAKTATKKGRRKRRKTGGYKLSDWDNSIINTINDKGHPMINSELLEVLKGHEIAKGMDEDQVSVKISQSIHKLANKRGIIKKTKYEGRGFAYATEHMVSTNGKVKQEFSRKG